MVNILSASRPLKPGIPDYEVIEQHYDTDGADWYVIRVYSKKPDRILQEKCDTDEERVGSADPGKIDFPCYNIHGSLMSYITLVHS
jgi:hypothetical protein